MRKFTFGTVAAAALTAGFLGLAAPAMAAPSGGNAADTIAELEAQGNHVVVNRESATPLDEATIVSIDRGPVQREVVPNATSNGDSPVSVTNQTIYVTVK